MLGSKEGGNERYIKNLAYNLIRRNKNNITLLTANKFILRKEDNKKYLISNKMLIKKNINNFKRIYYSLPAIAKKIDAQIIHSTTLCPIFSPAKSVITIHDISFIKYPQFYSLRENLMFKFLLPISIRKSSAIIVPSKFTKRELLKYYPYSKNKIHVTPEAAEPVFRVHSKNKSYEYLRKKYNINFPYLLALNSSNPKKNINNIIKGFIKAKKRIPDIKLVVIGSQKNIESKYKKMEHIKLINYLSDEDLAIFYNCAKIFIYFSVYEGFGLPLIEAARCKCPIIASDTAINRETTNNTAVFVKIGSSDFLSQQIIKLTTDKNAREKIIKKSYNNALKYSWEKTAKLTENVYSKIT